MDTTPISQPTPKKSNSTLNWAILVVVLVVAIAGVIYAMTRNTSTSNSNTTDNTNTVMNTNNTMNSNQASNVNASTNTSNWSTYNNNTYRFSFQYPPQTRVFDYSSQNAQLYNGKLVGNFVVTVPEATPYIEVDVVNDTITNIKTYIEARHSGKTFDWSPTSIRETSAEMAKVIYGQNFYANYYIANKNGYIYIVTTFTSDDDEDSVIKGFIL